MSSHERESGQFDERFEVAPCRTKWTASTVGVKADSLMKDLRSQDPLIREQAACALARIFPITDDAILALGEALFDSQDEVCIEAGLSLFCQGVRSNPAIPQLTRALNHRNLFVVRLAMAALALIGPDAKDALPAIMEHMDSSDPYVQVWTKEALENIA